MRKSIVKILILLAAMAIVVVAVLLFLETRAEPYVPTKDEDVYETDLKESIKNLSGTKDEMDSPFNTAVNHITVFYQEKKIDAKLADKYMDDAVKKYAPVFLKYWDAKFKEKWDYPEFKAYSDQKNELDKLKHFSDGSEIFNDYLKGEYSELGNIVANWIEANRLSNNSESYKYSSYNNASQEAKKIKAIRDNEYLKHSPKKSLMDDALKKIGLAHHYYVESQVSSLDNFVLPNSKKTDYDKLYSAANTAVNDYDRNAENLYGSKNKKDIESSRGKYKKDIESLKTIIKNKNTAAEEHYKKRSSGSTTSSSNSSSGGSSGSTTSSSNSSSGRSSTSTSSSSSSAGHIQNKTYTVNVGQRIKLDYKLANDETYKNENDKICTLSRDGYVTGKSKGKTIVWVYKGEVIRGHFTIEVR